MSTEHVSSVHTSSTLLPRIHSILTGTNSVRRSCHRETSIVTQKEESAGRAQVNIRIGAQTGN